MNRMERANLKQKNGLAKVIGTSLTVSGAMLMTLYKGPVVDIFGYSPESGHHNSSAASSDQHWAAGTIMLLLCSVGWSAFFIVQVSWFSHSISSNSTHPSTHTHTEVLY